MKPINTLADALDTHTASDADIGFIDFGPAAGARGDPVDCCCCFTDGFQRFAQQP